MDDEDAVSLRDAQLARDGWRAVRDALRNRSAPAIPPGTPGELAELCSVLAMLAAVQLTTKAAVLDGLNEDTRAALVRDRDEDQAYASALAEAEDNVTAYELALLDGGRVPPPLPDDAQGRLGARFPDAFMQGAPHLAQRGF